jgi:anti-sigma factor RsiW
MSLLENHPSRKLTSLVHGELSVAESTKVRTHLALCPDCGRRVRDIERVVALVRDPSRPEIPSGLTLPTVAPAARPNRAGAALLAVAAAAAAALILALVLVRRGPAARRETAAAETAPFEKAAMRFHRERLRGELSFDMCDGSPDQVRTWACRESGLETQTPAGARDGPACASLVTAAGAPAVLVAFDSNSRPLTLVTARRQDLARTSWPRSPITMRDPASGVSLRAWTDADQAFVLVSGRPGA